ncbi:hypothetical protein GGX14DRAFT_406532 [Mycena pura]|uniref:F-box domain-containing protein n=1 Tax=Mycena pura TaxID=153505 RepID=A0AAD6XZM5_9AGAR|nr:hypothetical protein GGX14DRAFT_578293 [Mycena pura]KAJ7192277.1 hypothetical protein GGX14DRAFT_406532 [Mycena pura]
MPSTRRSLPAGAPRVPAELVDQVLKNFDPYDDDKGTLLDCGLVSHTWLSLSRSILFFSIFITPFPVRPNNDRLLKAYQCATIRPYVREIVLGVDPAAEWTRNHLPALLAQFPELTTLRFTKQEPFGRMFGVFTELQRLGILAPVDCLPPKPSPKSGVIARIRRAFTFSRYTTAILRSNSIGDDKTGPFVVHKRAPLSQLSTIHIDYPTRDVPVLELLAPPALTTIHLTLRECDKHAVHAYLRAAAPTLRTLVLSFPWQLMIECPSTPLPMPELRTLHIRPHDVHRLYSGYSGSSVIPVPCSMPGVIMRAAHLLERVLAVPRLEELGIDAKISHWDDSAAAALEAARNEFSRVLRTLPAMNAARIRVSL